MHTTLIVTGISGTRVIASPGDTVNSSAVYQSSAAKSYTFTLVEGGPSPKYTIPANIKQATPPKSLKLGR